MLIVSYKEIIENGLFVNPGSLAIILLHPHMYENNVNIKPVLSLLKKVLINQAAQSSSLRLKGQLYKKNNENYLFAESYSRAIIMLQ